MTLDPPRQDADFESFAQHWDLEPGLRYLNHGAFGACPRPVLQAQNQIRARMERQPTAFFQRQLFNQLDEARAVLAAFLGTSEAGLAFLPNPTSGVNAVLASLRLEPGAEILVTDHAYNACRNALDMAAKRCSATVRVVAVPFPLDSADAVTERVLDAAGPATRIAMLDHVTSPTGLVMPLEQLVPELDARGIDVLVDGAHAPGMVELNLDHLGAAWYAGHCHKWLCAPKGAAFLHVREDQREAIAPLVISHGLNRRRPKRSLFHDLFDWGGTIDPSAYLCVPESIAFVGSLLPGGWRQVRERNRNLALAGRALVLEALGLDAPAPEAMIGSLAAIPLPGAGEERHSLNNTDPLQDLLVREYRIEIPVSPWGSRKQRLLRLSAQLYNSLDDYRRLAVVLPAALAATTR